MALTIGSQLGSHEITALLGKGGMGEVYRARDLKLKREVAIKILPEEFSRDADRVNRFQREAEVLASINHPNIAAIYDLEEAGDRQFLVLELVEGETLAERIRRGPLPIEEAIHVAENIAEALEAAHEKGVVHRDLKPANIKVTTDGKVKVLDFGLAKLMTAKVASADSADLPTVMGGTTAESKIVGTAAYMSPEQARGQAIDRRTDLWAFGCVLYEMLGGRQAFGSETISDSIVRILRDDPDWEALPAALPQNLLDLLRRCLHKNPRQRLHDIADARIEIEEILSAGLQNQDTSSPAPVRDSRRALRQLDSAKHQSWAIPLVSSLLAGVVTGIVVWNLNGPAPSGIRPITRFVASLPATERLGELGLPRMALSPDGTHLAFVADNHRGANQLYIRAMDQLDAVEIPNAQGGQIPFFSPDGKWVGFFNGGRLKKVSVSGGAPVDLGDAPSPRGASWGTDDTIIFAPTATSPLWQISANGGSARVATTLDSSKGESAHRWPDLLPGGKAVLFSAGPANSGWNETEIVVQSLETGNRRVLIRGGAYARYLPTGHLVYARAGTLFAVPFDLERLEVRGDPVPIVEDIAQSSSTVAAQFAFSMTGLFVYIPGSVENQRRRLVWVDRNGSSQPVAAPARAYLQPRLSPDGKRIAVGVEGAKDEIWIYDISRDTLTRLTLGGFPVWTPDGSSLIFSRAGLFLTRADGSGTDEQLVKGGGTPQSFSPDGRILAFHEQSRTTARDIWLLPLDGDRKPWLFLGAPYDERVAMFSPDGKWLAYLSDELGQEDLYIHAFPGPSGKWQISTEGASEPVWARNGHELFYRNGNKLMAVDITSQPAFAAGKPRLILDGRYVNNIGRANYDVSPDGQRFLMVEAVGQETQSIQLNIVLEWFEDVKRRVPFKKN